MPFKFKNLPALFLAAWLGAVSLSGQGVIDIPGIEREAGERVYPVSVTSEDTQVQALARRAFTVHGAFRVVEPTQAAVRIALQRTASNRVTVVVTEGGGSRVLFRETSAGESLNEAALRACDLAVERIAGLPGIFAGRLAFVGERTGYKEIYTGDLFFQQYRAITQDRSKSISPRWSPDGRRIVYTGYFRSGFPEIYMIDLENRSRDIVARYRGTNTGGTFSPDGRRMAMVLSSPGNPELYIADADGQRPRRMTINNSLEASPDFSPRGDRIVLTSDPMGVPQIYVMDAGAVSRNNSGMQRIARNVSRNCSEPVWNPRDENLIAFTLVQGGGFQIGLYNFERDAVEVLTQGPGDSVEPTWTRDGRHLIFTRRTGSRKELRIMDTVTRRDYALHTQRVGATSQAHFFYP